MTALKDFWDENSTEATELSNALSGGDGSLLASCIELALRAQSLEPLEKLEALNLSPSEISEMFKRHGDCFQDMIDEIKALE